MEEDVQGIQSNGLQQSAAVSNPAAAHLGVILLILEAHKITPDDPMSQGAVRGMIGSTTYEVYDHMSCSSLRPE